MSILFDYFANRIWLALLLGLFLMPFIVLVIRKLIHFIKILGLYRRVRYRPAWSRSNMSPEEIGEHLRETAGRHQIQDGRHSRVIERLHWQIYMSLQHLRRRLSHTPAGIIGLVPASQWFFDNYNLFYKEHMKLQEYGNLRKFRKMPVLSQDSGYSCPRVYMLAREIVGCSGYHINEKIVLDMLEQYQAVKPLFARELWSLPEMLVICLMEKMIDESRQVIEIIRVKRFADRVVNRMSPRIGQNYDDMAGLLKKESGLTCLNDKVFISHFYYRMKSMSVHESVIADWIAEALNIDRAVYSHLFKETISQEEQFEAAAEATIRALVNSLKAVSDIDWNEELQQASQLDKLLAEDPAGIYPKMNGQTRSLYRVTVEKLARRQHLSEGEVAAKALEAAHSPPVGIDIPAPEHIGSYLVGQGLAWFTASLAGRTKLKERFTRYNHIKLYSTVFYYLGIFLLTGGILAAFLPFLQPAIKGGTASLILIALAMLIPAINISSRLMQDISAKIWRPQPQLAMDFSESIPDDCRTIVVMPVIWGSSAQVGSFVDRLEKHYLANQQNNLYFAILGDFKDAPNQVMPTDDDLLQTAVQAISRLNSRYPGDYTRFLLLYRPRFWNSSENCWMGWERKRGKLEELNALLAGEKNTSYLVPVGDVKLLTSFKYVITLDADTELTRESAATMIGIMAHPANRPRIDESQRKIIDGYAIVQPEVRNRLPGPSASIFLRLISGQAGIDPYATVVSDIYQDVFQEGIFTGKGIYDAQVMYLLLRGAIPENSILSHDLLEGSLSRCAFASGVKLMDRQPSGIISYVRREHRWIRGDWQLLPWLAQATPINWLSRWKILDNLRRSLVQPAYLLLIFGSAFLTPSAAWIWIPFVCFDPFFSILSMVLKMLIQKNRNPSLRLAMSAFWNQLAALLLQLSIIIILIPYRSFQAADAIVRTLYRLIISHRKLLEWQTAEDTEQGKKNTLSAYIKEIGPPGLAAALLGWGLQAATQTNLLGFMSFIALFWLFSPFFAWLSSIPSHYHPTSRVPPETLRRLRLSARRTWNYFEDFASDETQGLCPDNYQKYPGPKVSNKTSPTNIGLQMLSALAARDLGYLGLQALLDYCEPVLRLVQNLPKWHGHLYNWYQIKPIAILEPQYVSTVDSGNFCAHLIALKNGLLALRDQPVFSITSINGLKDTLAAAGLDTLLIQDHYDNLEEWIKTLYVLQNTLDKTPTDQNWKRRLNRLYSGLLDDARKFGIAGAWNEQKSLRQMAEAGHEQAIALITRIEDLAALINHLVRDADFKVLYDRKHRLFLIGYHVSSQTPDAGRYDLMASEARLTSFLAIAKGDVSQKHWFALGRPFTLILGTPALLSWSGSMFEYLMPNLVLKTPPGSIFSSSSRAAVNRQIIQGFQMKLPWGVSESQFYLFDQNANYQYTAFGVMRLRLQSTLRPARVVAPYATLLALTVNPRAALRNIDRLRQIGAEGEYGFYEALDYSRPDSTNLRPFSLVQTVMVHHQGMSLTALDNFLNHNIMQTRFHQEPMVQAAETLLEETGTVGLLAVSRRWYTINVNTSEAEEEADVSRYYPVADLVKPVAHVLANQQYMLMLTSDGDGFSSCNGICINRWRPDIFSGGYGFFIYIQNQNTGQLWSSAFRPTRKQPDRYQAVFSSDKAEYNRQDGTISTRTEITLSPLENLEIRRVSLTNHGDLPVGIDITSYLEVVADTYQAEAAHPAFNKLFMEIEYQADKNLLIAKRRTRSPNDPKRYVMHRLVAENDSQANIEYEIDRQLFIGRNGTLLMPQAMDKGRRLSCRTGFTPDPILCLRGHALITPGHTVTFVYLIGYATSLGEIVQLNEHYDKFNDAGDIFKLALTSSKLEMKYLSIRSVQLNAILELVAAIYYPDRVYRGPAESVLRNQKGQSGLWRFGISGDFPIMLLRVMDLKSAPMINDVLLAFEVLRLHHIPVDLVILNDEESGYVQEMTLFIQNMTSRLIIFNDTHAKPCLFTLNRFQLSPDELDLLLTTACLVFTSETGIYFRNRKAESMLPEIKPAETGRRKVIQLSAGTAVPIAPTAAALPQFGEAEEPLEFDNGYGGFAKDGREYVIRIRNGIRPPSPWINVIANEGFGFHISESGAGYTWAGNSRENKLTAWSNDPVIDQISEVIYIRDEASGALTSPFLLQPGYGGNYQVRHGFGYSVFEHQELDLDISLNIFVDTKEPVKIWLLNLTNQAAAKGRYTLTFYVKWVLGVMRDQSVPYLVTAFDHQNSCLTAQNVYQDLYRGQHTFIFASEPIVSYTGDRREFLSTGTSLRFPSGLALPVFSNTVGVCSDPCGVIQIALDFAPSESKTLVFGLGQTDSPEKSARLIKLYQSPEYAENALLTVKQEWERELGGISVRTPDRALDILMNGWLRYQVLACRIRARAAFYQCGGAYGFRDQLQDVLAFLDGNPDLARRQILLCSSRQFIDGDVQHWWHPPTGAGVRTLISDDLLWLPYVTAEYTAQTGDLSILAEQVPYLDGESLQNGQHEIMFTPQESTRRDTVYRHCLAAINHACRFGRNGLPLMGGGDWNDGMNAVGIGGSGESVWLGWFLYSVLHSFIQICRQMDDPIESRHMASIAANLLSNLENKAWDGMWYLRGFFDNGHPLGSKANDECQIDSVSQSWAILTNAANRKKAEKALDSASYYLVHDDSRAIQLLTPPFDQSTDNPGYIRGYYPGVRENGGQYTHAAVWLAMAAAKLKKTAEAWRFLNLLNPIRSTQDMASANLYEKEPYVMSADICMAEPYKGRAGWSWYTGSAGWMYQAVLKTFLGINRQDGRLIIDPCIPFSWKGYQADYQIGRTLYQITIQNKNGDGATVQSMTVDGVPADGNSFELIDDGGRHQVVVRLNERKH